MSRVYPWLLERAGEALARPMTMTVPVPLVVKPAHEVVTVAWTQTGRADGPANLRPRRVRIATAGVEQFVLTKDALPVYVKRVTDVRPH